MTGRTVTSSLVLLMSRANFVVFSYFLTLILFAVALGLAASNKDQPQGEETHDILAGLALSGLGLGILICVAAVVIGNKRHNVHDKGSFKKRNSLRNQGNNFFFKS